MASNDQQPNTQQQPLSTFLIPIVLIVVVGVLLTTGRAKPNATAPPTINPGQNMEVGESAEKALAELPLYPGAEVKFSTPYLIAVSEDGLGDVRDFYKDKMGTLTGFSESNLAGTERRRAILYASADMVVQLTETAPGGSTHILFAPLAELQQANELITVE